MKYKEYEKLRAYYSAATGVVKRINALDSFLRGLQYRLRENRAAQLEITVRHDQSRRQWDAGASMKLPVDIVGKLLLPIVKSELAKARQELRDLQPMQLSDEND